MISGYVMSIERGNALPSDQRQHCNQERSSMRHNMMKNPLNCVLRGLLTLGIMVSAYSMVLAGEEEDMAVMQKSLNQKVMERPFNPGDKASLDAYLEEALKNGVLPPQLQPPRNWRPGWTCNNLMSSYSQYRNCLHYQRYYGHYYGQ